MLGPRVYFFLILVAFVVPVAMAVEAGASAGIREALPNDISIEAAGRSIVYTFNFQRMIGNYVGLETGVSALGGGISEANALLVFVPVGAKLYLMPQDGAVYLTGGVVFINASVHVGPFEEGDEVDHSEWGTYNYVGLGMEYRSSSGLLFRGTAYGLIADGGFFIWPGLSIGYTF